jgi:hypothetical protein
LPTIPPRGRPGTSALAIFKVLSMCLRSPSFRLA